jgi:hypothetical protein
MQRGQALIELLLIAPFFLLLALALGAFAAVTETTRATTDGLKDRLWFSDSRLERLTESHALPTGIDDALFPVTLEREGSLRGDDGFLHAGDAFQSAVRDDNLVMGELGLELTQASVELIRRIGSPVPFREVRQSRITAVGVTGHRDMSLPARIIRHD